jgi:hypothetical protein
VLNLHYDPVARQGLVRLRQGKSVRTRRLSEQATGDYDRSGRLLSISISELDATAAEFLRTGDEETLLRVIERQAGTTKAGTRRRPGAARDDQPARPAVARPRKKPAGAASANGKPKAKPAPKAAPRTKPTPTPAATDEQPAAPKKRRRRRSRRPASAPPEAS